MTQHDQAHAVSLQRFEGLAALVAGLVIYNALEQSWYVFALLFLAPDLFMLGYLRSSRIGALSYNTGHTYVAPAFLAMFGLAVGPLAYGLAAILLAHIGLDRALGYGLKLGGGFGHTHLGRVGKAHEAVRMSPVLQ